MSERWKQIELLYHAALERETATRAAFLAEACAGDEELRREVVSLIGYDGKPASFVESPVLEVAARELADESFALSQPPDTPSQIGAYRILSLLGRGGMGEVWLAQDTRLGRRTAVKLLPSEFTNQPERVRRFEQEARAASALNHPNIVTIYEIGEVDGRKFIVTEYVEGDTLRQRMSKAPERRLRLNEALEIAAQVAAALQAAHEAGITHRDIKPENVMSRKDGLVKVLDFGLAKLNNTQAGSQAMEKLNTRSGMVMGTASYMSPEQARGEKVDHRTDIFSLGVMLYETLAGRRPFEGATASDVMAAVLTNEPVSLVEVATDVPVSLWRIVRRCLEKEPERRFQSAGDLAFALEEMKASSDFSQGVKSAKGTTPETRPVASSLNRIGKGWARWALAATILLAAIVVVAVFLLRKQPDEILAVSFTFSLPDNLELRMAPAVSPDGKYIVYCANPVAAKNRNEFSLWLRSLDSSEARPIPGTEGGFAPFWSPDSRYIAFWANMRLQKIDVTGGSPVTICETDVPLSSSWSNNGVILFSRGPTLNRVSASGGPVVALKPFGVSETGQHNAHFLPDGKHFLYLSRNQDNQNDGIYVASLETDTQRKLVIKDAVFGSYVSTGHLLYSNKNQLMAQAFDLRKLEVTGEPVRITEQVANNRNSAAFSASKNGVLAWKIRASDPDKTQLTWFDRSGERLGTVGASAMHSGPLFRPARTVWLCRWQIPRQRCAICGLCKRGSAKPQG